MDEFETSDLTPSLSLWLAGSTLTLLAGSALLVLGLEPGSPKDRDLRPSLYRMAEPALQNSPRAELRRFLAKQQADFPIGDATRRILRDGIPGWPERR